MMRWLLFALALGACTPTPQADYRAGRYPAAAEGFAARMARRDTSVIAAFNLGTTRIRMREYASARAVLEGTAARAIRHPSRFEVEFNAGSADLEPGLASPHPDSAALLRAVQRYRAALRLRPEDIDAKWNLELAERALAKPPEQTSGGGDGGEGAGQQPAGRGQAPATRPERDPGNPGLTRQEADRILTAADQEERAVQRRRVQPAPSEGRAARDW